MKALKCMVVDDEPLAVKMLENFISKTSFLSLEASFTDPVAALEAIRTQRPQLVFLDIQMPDLNGMELSRMVPDGTRVIFTTAFKDYAFDSYEVSALDFLLKPIRYQKFLEAAEKARQWFELLESAETPPSPDRQPDPAGFHLRQVRRPAAQGGLLRYPLRGGDEGLRPAAPLLREAAARHAHHDEGRGGAAARRNFMRVHRSYIVALDKIDSIEGSYDISVGDTLIHVSDAYKPAFEKYLAQRMLR